MTRTYETRAMQKKERTIDLVASRAAELEPWRAYLFGNRFAQIIVIKGDSDKGHSPEHAAFFGKDGEALEAAFFALGFEKNCWCGISLHAAEKKELSPGEVRLLIETVDPQIILALDTAAMSILVNSYGTEMLPQIPKPGVKTRLLGRSLVYVNDFEAGLASKTKEDGEARHRVWKELKALKS